MGYKWHFETYRYADWKSFTDFFQWYFFLLSFSQDFFQSSIYYLTEPKQKQTDHRWWSYLIEINGFKNNFLQSNVLYHIKLRLDWINLDYCLIIRYKDRNVCIKIISTHKKRPGYTVKWYRIRDAAFHSHQCVKSSFAPSFDLIYRSFAFFLLLKMLSRQCRLKPAKQ